MPDPFITVDEYRRLYPELVKEALAARDAPPRQEPVNADIPQLLKTPSMLLQEAQTKLSTCRQSEIAKFEENMLTEVPPKFECRAKLGRYVATATGRSKKIAKQVASLLVLRLIVENDHKFSDYGIPGNTKEEARAYLDSTLDPDCAAALAEFERGGDGSPVPNAGPAVIENWVGKLNELCAKEKLDNAVYRDSSTGPPNDCKYTVTVTVRDVSASGEARKKQQAKTIAAQKLYEQLSKNFEQQRDLVAVDEPNAEADADENEEEFIDGPLGVPGVDISTVMSEEDPVARIRAILDDDSKFFKGGEISSRALGNPSKAGKVQYLVTVKSASKEKTNGDPQQHVFAGEGQTEEEAKKAAGRNALIHFMTY